VSEQPVGIEYAALLSACRRLDLVVELIRHDPAGEPLAEPILAVWLRETHRDPSREGGWVVATELVDCTPQGLDAGAARLFRFVESELEGDE
jgi:hypothetical protein